MTLIILLIILAIALGLTGVLVEGLMWLLIIGVILFLVSGVLGFTRRGRGGV